jgi:hypothetical protein
MTLYDTEALTVESDQAANSLPDPTTVSGRTHLLTNTGAVTSVWSSVGATPFSVGGVNVATISVTRGMVFLLQSDGTHWVAKSSGGRQFFAGSGVTDGSGNVTFTFPTAFPVAPNPSQAVQTAIADVTECRVTALSTTAVTFHVQRSPAVTILGISVLSAAVPAVGVTVHTICTTPGQTP